MKKIFKSKRISNIIFGILGLIIGGGIGITATTYVLQANEIEYKNNKSVQEAIEELYTMAQNSGGSTGTLPIGVPTVKSIIVMVPYTGTYDDIKCLYGTDENYGIKGSANSNICEFIGTAGNQTLYYKIIATNNDGKIYENSGTVTTGSETNVIKSDIPAGTKAIIYLDPTDLSATCNEANSTVGGTAKSGCMKWYAFKEDETSYTMILDHNTSSAAWSLANSSALESDISDWQVSARLISCGEVSGIEGVTASNTEHLYYNIASSVSWLLGYKYWTSSSSSGTAGAWFIGPALYSHLGGYMNDQKKYTSDSTIRPSTELGVRPVITGSKSDL